MLFLVELVACCSLRAYVLRSTSRLVVTIERIPTGNIGLLPLNAFISTPSAQKCQRDL